MTDEQLARISLRSRLGVDDRGLRSHLSFLRYGVLTGAGLMLTALQLLLMARWLDARQFGLVVLSISATQAVLGMGDLAMARLCIDATREPADRARLRSQGHSAVLMTTAALVVVTATLAFLYPARERAVPIVLAFGGLAAAMAAADRFRATREEVAGDEVGASALNFLWSNSPKIGLLVGLLLFRRAVWITLVAVAATALISAPSWPGFGPALRALREVRTWASPFVALVASFVLTWSDTYFLSAHQGVGRAGAYEALYRVLGVCTYLFLPWVSVLTSRVSVDEHRPVMRPLVLSVTATALGLVGATAFVSMFAPSVFPHLRLPLEALPGLLVMYLLLPVSYSLGSALYVRARTQAVTRASVLGAVVAVGGHVIFTLRGGPSEAAMVAAAAMAVAVASQAIDYLRTVRSPRALVATEGRPS